MNRTGSSPPAKPGGSPSHPLVSVIIPAYDAELTLAETLRSAAAQTYVNLEIVIVDDGSTDGTAAIAERFCRDEPRARLFRKENGGVASARNFGIEQAEGEWIAPLDADDLWHPTKIAKQVAVALSAPVRPGFVYCWYQHIDEQGGVFASGSRRIIEGSAFAQLAYLNPVENGSALLILKQAAREVGGYDSSLRARGGEGCEDQMIQLKIARRYPIAAVPEHLVGYRVHSRSMSRDSDQMLRSWQLVYGDLAGAGLIPSAVDRWMTGLAKLGLAETRLQHRRLRDLPAPIAAAVWLDPVRCGGIVAYRFVRLVVRVLRGRRVPRPRPPFTETEPLDYIPRDPYEIKRLTALLDAIDSARLRRLAREPATCIET